MDETSNNLGNISLQFWTSDNRHEGLSVDILKEYVVLLKEKKFLDIIQFLYEKLNIYPGAPDLRYNLYLNYMYSDQPEKAFQVISDLYHEFPECGNIKKSYINLQSYFYKLKEIELFGNFKITEGDFNISKIS